jgi:ABC-type uncharacterized transport system substrate-binding protein
LDAGAYHGSRRRLRHSISAESNVNPNLLIGIVALIIAVGLDPVSGGFVESLARPGGNTTGFASMEYGMSGKWLELLKQIAPGVTRAAVLRDPSIPSGSGQLGAIQAVGRLSAWG